MSVVSQIDNYSLIIALMIYDIERHLSAFAVWLCYKYVQNPKQPPNMASPFCIVTALVDRMDFTAHNLKVGRPGQQLAGKPLYRESHRALCMVYTGQHAQELCFSKFRTYLCIY